MGNIDQPELYEKAWCQWLSFVKNNSASFNSGAKGIEEKAFELLPTLMPGERVRKVLFSAQKRTLYWQEDYILSAMNSDQHQHRSFTLLEPSTRQQLYVEPFRLHYRRTELAYVYFVPMLWLQLSLDELSDIAQGLKEYLQHAVPIDTTVKWANIRPRTKMQLRRSGIQKALEMRYGITPGKMKLTFGEVCAYIVLRQLEDKGKAYPAEVIKTLIEQAESDALLLVEL